MAIGVMGAMPEEVGALLADMNGRRSLSGGREFMRGTLFGRECVLVFSRCGKVAAAATALDLILRERVDRIIFLGLAGSLSREVRVGDVVVATELLQHDMDASPLFPRYEVPLTGRSRFPTDPAARRLAADAARAFLADGLREALPASALSVLPERPRVHEGVVITGDRFIARTEQADALRREIPDALCVEMEGAAVAQVCFDYATPFTIIRTISDAADDQAHDAFTRALPIIAGAYARGILSRLLRT